MAKYPGAENEPRIGYADLLGLCTQIFQRCAMSPAHAALLADSLVQADARGIHSHGVLRVPEYVKKLTVDGVDPKGEPRLVRDSGACMVVDGGNSMGQIGASFAMRHCIERARANGVAFAAVRGSNHCGAMDYFATMALAHDMIGIATTNALPTMAPWGGTDRIIGMNPLSVAIPGGDEDAMVLDIALAMSAHGKIRVYQQKGFPIPEGWAYDRDGRPTTDPMQAIAGLIAPIGAPSGGHKGVGLALVSGILSSFLSGAAFGTELGSVETGPKPGMDGHFFGAINVAAFVEPAQFKARVDGLVRAIRSGKRAAGVERLYAPGGMEAELERAYRRDGIPLNRETLAGLRGVCGSFQIPATIIEQALGIT